MKKKSKLFNTNSSKFVSDLGFLINRAHQSPTDLMLGTLRSWIVVFFMVIYSPHPVLCT